MLKQICKKIHSLFLLMLIIWVSVISIQAQDVFSGTGVVIKRTFVRTVSVSISPSRAPKGRARVRQAPTLEVSYLVEDAIALGNAQQEANPLRLAEAERAYQLAAKLNPKDARPHAWLGDVYFTEEQFTAAENALRRAITLDPSDAISYVRLSYMFSKLGRFDEADLAARRVQQLRPRDYYGYCSLGWSKFRRKNFAQAEEAYRRAIELSPKTSGLYSDLGLVLLHRGRVNEATEFFRRALEISPDNTSALVNYAALLQKSGNLEQASELYQRARQQSPKVSQAAANLGMIYYVRGVSAQARQEWEAAMQSGSKYQLDKIGLLILNGKLKEARILLNGYTQTFADNADGWLMLGDVCKAEGDRQAAKTAYEKALQLAPVYAKLPRPDLKQLA